MDQFAFTDQNGRVHVGMSAASLAALSPVDQAAGQLAMLKAWAAARRWSLQTGGITVGGQLVRTDDATRAALSQAVQAAAAGGASWSTPWKFADGTFGSIDGNKANALFAAVSTFITGCFGKEQAAVAAIVAGTATTPSQIDSFFS